MNALIVFLAVAVFFQYFLVIGVFFIRLNLALDENK